MIFDLKLSFDISQYWRFQKLACLLNQSLQVVACIFLLSSRLLLYFSLFRCFVSTYCETYFPTFVFFGTCLSENDFGKSGLLDYNKILWIFAPSRIISHLTLLLSIGIFFNLYFSGASCQILSPIAVYTQLNSFG